MAEKVVNSDIEFAYVSENSEIELKRELEKYFLYQNILIIDKYFEYGSIIEKLKHNTKCNIIVERDIRKVNNFEIFSCIINVNCSDLDFTKMVCYENNIPYILALTKVYDAFCFKSFIYDKFRVKKTNYPIGIIFSLNTSFKNTKLICQSILEISSLSFFVLQNKICSLFFMETNSNPISVQYKKILKELIDILQNKENIDIKYYKNILSLYLSYAILVSKFQPDVLDNLMCIYKTYCNKKNIIETKYAFVLIITSLEKNFFKFYNTSFKNQINYKKHQDFMKSLNLKPQFNSSVLPSAKVGFLITEFRNKFLSYIKTELAFQDIIKNQVAEIDVDYLFETFSNFASLNVTNYINIEQDIFKSQNFLTILFNEGLLNFDF